MLASLARNGERSLPFDLANATLDDEEETPDERAAVAEANAALARGDARPLGEVRRKLGL